MRTLYFVGFTAVAVVSAGVVQVGCSSSSPAPAAVVDSGVDTGTVACTPTPGNLNVATTDFGNAEWACTQMTCATDLAACAADCTCNNALLQAVGCSGEAGAMPSYAETVACFTPALTALAADPNVPMTLESCLIQAGSKCAGFPVDGGGDSGHADGGSEAGTSEAGPSEAGAEEAGPTEAGSADGGPEAQAP
jgi:hypothetical protein